MTTSNERRQVLDMLSEGKISADEAQRLLEKLESGTAPGDGNAFDPGRAESQAVSSAPVMTTAAVLVPDPVPQKRTRTMPRYLRILVTSGDGEEVNIRIPLQLVRAGVKLVAILPNEARLKIQESGVDLSKLNELEGDALIEALRELSIEVDSSKGEKIRIFCE